MTDPATLFMTSSAALAGIAMASAATLRAWDGWLNLKRLELDGRGGAGSAPIGRVEIRELKDRVRKLEAIANGIEI